MQMIREPWLLPIASQNLAAIEIQRMARGMLSRLPRPPVVTPRPRAVLAMKFLAEKRARADLTRVPPSGEDPMSGFETWCVSRIQAWWRMGIIRSEYRRHRFSLYHIAAMQIQNIFRAHLQRRRFAVSLVDPAVRHVVIIQRAYRRYYFRVIFHHFKELLRFKNAGDPITMLKSVNPREAALVDSASGTRVRFRLGGSSFPPNVYYKLFTNAAVCDMGAFAPRDYTDPTAKGVPATKLHNKSSATGDSYELDSTIKVGSSVFGAKVTLPAGLEDEGSGEYTAPDNWYHRTDNNGWRLVTLKVLEEGADEIASRAPRKPAVFHHSRARRKVDAIAAKKRRKREWMMKMYKEGLAKEKAGGVGKPAGDGPLAGRVDWDDDHWEEDAEELLEWSSALDFESYMSDWGSIGTSGHVLRTNPAILSVAEPSGGYGLPPAIPVAAQYSYEVEPAYAQTEYDELGTPPTFTPGPSYEVPEALSQDLTELSSPKERDRRYYGDEPGAV